MTDATTNGDAEPTRVMVIAAHPDDPEFGCAATIAKWAKQGKEITYVLLTSGDKGSRDSRVPPGELAGQREEEQREAARCLGVKQVLFLRHPDGLLENTMALRREISAVLREHRPNIVVGIDPWRRYQLHPDHRVAGQVALDGIYAAREWYVFPEQLVGDRKPWRVSEVYLFWTDKADYYEDVTCCLEERIAALKSHESQVGERREDIGKRIREWAKRTGEEVGYEYAEGFKRFKF